MSGLCCVCVLQVMTLMFEVEDLAVASQIGRAHV